MDDSELLAELKRLHGVTEDALTVIKNQREANRRSAPEGAINWADLHCTDALYITDEDGDSWKSVVIEEADPDNPELAEAVRQILKENGFEGVEIQVEW